MTAPTELVTQVNYSIPVVTWESQVLGILPLLGSLVFPVQSSLRVLVSHTAFDH